MKTLLLTIGSFLCLSSFSQSPMIEWQQIIGGEAIEMPGKIIQSTNGSYFSVGATSSTLGDLAPNKGGWDAWITKQDANGNFAWKKNFSGSGNDMLWDLIQTNDGNYIATGANYSSDGDLSTNTYSASTRGIWLIKFNDSGIILWQKRIGGSGGEVRTQINESANGELNVFASSTSNNLDVLNHYGTTSTYDIVYFRLTATGAIITQKTYGGSEDELLTGISPTNDGGFVVLSMSNSNDHDISQHAGGINEYNAWVFKIDNNHNLVWEKSWLINGMGQTSKITELSNGGVIFSWLENETLGYTDAIVTLLDQQGSLMWQKVIGGAKYDNINDFIEIAPNRIMLLGSTSSNDSIVVNPIPGEPVWLVEIDSLGTINWQKTYGGTRGEISFNFFKTNDNGFVIAAQSRSHDLDVINTNTWACLCYDVWLFKLSSISVGIKENSNANAFSLYPNPAKDHVTVNLNNKAETISYHLMNVMGQIILSGKFEDGSNQLDITGLAPGVYLLQINGNSSQSVKLIKN